MSQSTQNITFISTVHKEIGKCNADELCSILIKENPEVIFLESLESTYSGYERSLLSSFGVYHKKLEIKAIQIYNQNSSFVYVPVLDNGLSELFNSKYNRVCENIELQKMLDDFDLIASAMGFQFLNSEASIKMQEEMRVLECRLLNDNELNRLINKHIDDYENSMMRNIYSYCRNNQFEKAVYMCGVAHRKSIIEKIGINNHKENLDLNWTIFGH